MKANRIAEKPARPYTVAPAPANGRAPIVEERRGYQPDPRPVDWGAVPRPRGTAAVPPKK